MFNVPCLENQQGLIAVGLFAAPQRMEDAIGHSEHVGLFYSFSHTGADAVLLACQIVGMLFICGWVMFMMLPFFVWLDWRGWFRSDPLEEIVGLDTSYHGGLMLGGGEDHISPEYVTAFNKRREENVRSKSERNPHISKTILTDFDQDDGSYHSESAYEMDKSVRSNRSFKDPSMESKSFRDRSIGFDPSALERQMAVLDSSGRAEGVLEESVLKHPAALGKKHGGVSVDL